MKKKNEKGVFSPKYLQYHNTSEHFHCKTPLDMSHACVFKLFLVTTVCLGMVAGFVHYSFSSLSAATGPDSIRLSPSTTASKTQLYALDDEDVNVNLVPNVDAATLTAVGFGLIAFSFLVLANLGDGGIAGVVATIINTMNQ